MKFTALIIALFIGLSASSSAFSKGAGSWVVDFLDNFDTFNTDNWQDQLLWVNDEDQCYVPDNQFGTREISNGTLKIKVVSLDEPRSCDNLDKFGKKHPDNRYVAGRIASKNRQEFIKGNWLSLIHI